MGKNLIIYFTKNPRQLFLIDGLGALVSCIGLFLVMCFFANSFGLPKTALQVFLIVAIWLCCFSLTCFLFIKKRISFFLILIAVANFLYSALTIVLLFKNSSTITLIALIYFIIEIIIMVSVAIIELKTATGKYK